MLAYALTPPARQVSSEQCYIRRCLSVPLRYPIALGTNDTASVQTRYIVQHSEMFGCQLSNCPRSSSDSPRDRYSSTPLLKWALLLARTEAEDLGTPSFKSGQPTTHQFLVTAGPSRVHTVPIYECLYRTFWPYISTNNTWGSFGK
jgi:hypothetical protein